MQKMRRTLLRAVSIAVVAALVPAASRAGDVLTVDRLFELLEENSSALSTARAGAEAARHGVAAAKSARLPDIEAALSLSYTGNIVMTDRDFGDAQAFSTPHWGGSLSVEAVQTVYSGGALTAGVRLAEIEMMQAENGVTATRNTQRFLAIAQYLELMETDNNIRVYEENIALTERLIEDVQAKREQGMALRNDITRHELQRETMRLALREARDRRDVLNHRLCNTLRLDDGTTIIPDTTLMRLSEQEEEAHWQQKAALSAPEIITASLNTQAAEQQLRLARSERLPKLLAFAADNFSGPYNYDIPPIDNNFNVWYVGIGITYSISSLFKANKQVRRAEASLRESHEAREQTAEDTDNRVNEAYTLYLQAFANYRTRQKSAQLARENYEVVYNRYLNDVALITDMTDALNVRLSAELDETDARIRIVYTYYKMKYAAGDI